MIRDYGKQYLCDFPSSDIVLQTIGYDDIAVIKEKCTEHKYILTKKLGVWTMLVDAKEPENAEWVMALDDFENGWGNREYPHCSNCKRGVYRHDAGSWCPFCGAAMNNPMRC